MQVESDQNYQPIKSPTFQPYRIAAQETVIDFTKQNHKPKNSHTMVYSPLT